MISSSAGPGAVYLTDEEELTYEWYREIIGALKSSSKSAAILVDFGHLSKSNHSRPATRCI